MDCYLHAAIGTSVPVPSGSCKRTGLCGDDREDQPPQLKKPRSGEVREHALFPGGGEQMVSFSSPSAMAACSSPPRCLRDSAVFNAGNLSLQGVLARVRGPFTPAQWTELEQQLQIYQCIAANAPPPASLVGSLKSIGRSGFPSFAPSMYSSSGLGWGTLHLGYAASVDPEPGRCRRTDGKKWRCSRDAVSEQKYCERHLNRGRHRSRKHVEGFSSHAAKATSASPLGASATAGGTSSNSRTITMPTSEISATDPFQSCPTELDRIFMSKGDLSDNATKSYSNNQKTLEVLIQSSKDDRFRSDAVSNEPDKPADKHPVGCFADEREQLDRTQLSMSISAPAVELSSASSALDHGKLSLSPLRSSPDDDRIQMGLGVGDFASKACQDQPGWAAVAWDTSVGGPLGEVFTNRTPRDAAAVCSSPSLNLIPNGWITSSPLHLSPTGVLQSSIVGSVSSSTASSPVPENSAEAAVAAAAHRSHSILCNAVIAPNALATQTVPLL